MINIIKSDLFRLRNSKRWIITMFVLFILVLTPGLYTMQFSSTGSGDSYLTEVSEGIDQYCHEHGIDPYELTNEQRRELCLGYDFFKPDLTTIGGNYIYFEIMVIILEILLVTRDFSCHSIKNTLTAPVSRKTYFFAKALNISAISFAGVIVLNIYTWIVNLIINGSAHALSLGAVLLGSLMQLFPLLLFISICNFLAFIIRKSVPYIVSILAILIFVSTILINLLILSGLPLTLLWFMPSNLFGYAPFIGDPDYGTFLLYLAIACVTVIPITTIGGYLTFKKKEVK